MDVERALNLTTHSSCANSRDEILRGMSSATLNQFLRYIAECRSCNGTGTIAVNGAPIVVTNQYAQVGETYSSESPMPCPTCESSTFDPDFTRWECQVDEYRPCSPLQQADVHQACGYRVSLPLQVDLDTVGVKNLAS